MKNSQNRGFIRFIILIIVVLIVLSYLGFDVRKIIYSPTVVRIATLVWSLVVLFFKFLVSLFHISSATIISILQYLVNFVQNLKPPLS